MNGTTEPAYVIKMREQQAALAAFDAGEAAPAGNRFAERVERHAAGQHGASDFPTICPVCARAKKGGK